VRGEIQIELIGEQKEKLGQINMYKKINIKQFGNPWSTNTKF
jgi:hypothetical protein